MSSRTLNTEESATAVAELKAVFEELDIPAEFVQETDQRVDLILPGPLYVEVKSAPRPSLAQLRRWRSEDVEEAEDRRRVVVLVADWIDPGLRDELKRASWGWLERAGHLHLVAGGFHVDREIGSLLAPETQTPAPLRRESGLAVAVELLARRESAPPWDVTVRDVAEAAGVSVGSAHKAMTELSELALLGEDGMPRSSLFWATAREWRVRWFPLSQPPATDVSETVQRLVRFRLQDLRDAGWASVGDGAAAADGAPIVAEGPPRLLLPDRRALTWALRTFGEAADERSAAAFIAAAPTAAAVRRRRRGDPWPLARPIVVAIQLASSGSRGREALEQWPDPPAGVLDDR